MVGELTTRVVGSNSARRRSRIGSVTAADAGCARARLPGRTARRIGVRLGQPPLEVLSLFVRQRERFVLVGDAVPKLLDQLSPLGCGELEEFLSKGVLHRNEPASDLPDAASQA